MNSTKKITQGAMMLAILGALILIDRVTSYLFTEIIVLIIPIVIILYAAMNTWKDGLILSVGILILSFILGNFYSSYLIYCPVGIITGCVYSNLLSKNKDRRTLMLAAICTYVIAELLAYFIIYPLLGVSIGTMMEEYKELLNEVSTASGLDYESIFTSAGLSFDKVLIIIYFAAVIVTGAVEGLFIHILSCFLLKRFKIKDIGIINIWESKPNKVVAYAGMLLCFGGVAARYVNGNETLMYILIALFLIGSIILLYYGYVFTILYCKIVLRKNIAFIFLILLLFMPSLLIVYLILGFLYGAGPLREYLERKLAQI